MRLKPALTSVGMVLLFLLAPACASVLSATRDDDRATLTRLLRSGANPDQGSSEGVTPLFEAIEQGNVPVVRMLVEAGANVNKESRCRGRNVAPLHKAAIHGDLRLVRYLLEKGADATAIGDGNNVFSLMAFSSDARERSARMAEVILKHIEEKKGREGALGFLDQRTPSGWTALASAASVGDGALVDALLAGGAKVDVFAASRAELLDSDEWPPLHFAAVHHHDGIVERLVRAGADPNQRSRNGLTSAEVIAKLAQRRAELEARRERERREEAERSRRTFEAFQSGLQSGYQAASSPENPVNDDSFQRKMRELANRPRPTPSPSTEPDDEPHTRSSSDSERSGNTDTANPTGRGVTDSSPPSPGSAPAASQAAATDTPKNPEKKPAADRAAATAAAAEAKRQQEEARKQEEERKRAKDKADREARAEAEKVAAQQARDAYLNTMRQGIQLVATKCMDDAGHYYVTGRMPSAKGGFCIDVSYRASCPDNVSVSTGVARNFVGRPGCYGDTYQIEPKPKCPVDRVTVRVTDVQPCN